MVFKLFPSLFDNPAQISFAEQEDDEHIELFLRQHWVTNVPWIITSLIAIFLPIFVIQIDKMSHTSLLLSAPTVVLLGFIIIWYFLVFAYVIEKFLYWYANVYVVTNLNAVDIDFYSLLLRDIIEVDLRDIESQSSEIKGLFGSTFNYGDVTIETAAESQKIQFESIPNPDLVADRIQDLRRKLGKEGE